MEDIMEIKTFDELQMFIKLKLSGDIRVNYNSNDNGKFIIIIEVRFGFFQYHMSYQKNTRNEGYYFYEDWIYTEEEMVKMIYNDISKFI